jgi:SAM-dependent methyltransferase
MDDHWWKDSKQWDQRFIDQDTPWDLGEVSPTLAGLEKSLELVPGSSAFIPGCGAGWDALHFARLGHKVSVVDWSNIALEDLRVLCRREELDMEVLCSNFFEVPKSWYWTFDVWLEHTFFCAVNPKDWELYVQMSLNLLKAKSHFIACFFVAEDPQKPPPIGSMEADPTNPPFFVTEKRVRELFEPHFEIIKFGPTEYPHPKRGPFEWQAHFVRK